MANYAINRGGRCQCPVPQTATRTQIWTEIRACDTESERARSSGDLEPPWHEGVPLEFGRDKEAATGRQK